MMLLDARKNVVGSLAGQEKLKNIVAELRKRKENGDMLELH